MLDVERYTVSYTDVRGLAERSCKPGGARNASAGRLKGLTGPKKFAAMQAAYETYRQNGRLPATYEVVFGQAWAPAAPRGAIAEENRISLQDVKRQLRMRRDS